MMSDTSGGKSAACETEVQSQYPPSEACNGKFGLPAHLVVKDTSAAGRAVFTTQPIPLGAPILHTLPYAIGVFDSHRKRLCSYLPCSLYAPAVDANTKTNGTARNVNEAADVTAATNAAAGATRTANVNGHRGFFISHCSACDQAFYCSASCLRLDARKHALACGALKKLRGWAKDRHVASVLKLIILVLAERKWAIISNSGSRSAPSSAAVRPRDNVGDAAGVIAGEEVDCGDNEADKIRSTYLKRLGYSFGEDFNSDERQCALIEPLGVSLSQVSLDTKLPLRGRSNRVQSITRLAEDDKIGDEEEDCIARPTFQDVMALQSHVSSWPVEDARDWEQHASFTMSLFDRSPDLIPDQWTFEDLLNLASRIESNGFGCFSEDTKVVDMCGGEMRNGLRSLQPADHLHLEGNLGDDYNPSPVNTRKPSSSICFARALYPIASLFNHSCEPTAHAEPLIGLRLHYHHTVSPSSNSMDPRISVAAGEPAPGSASEERFESPTLRQSEQPRGGRAHTSCQVTHPATTRTEIAPKFEMVGVGRPLTFMLSMPSDESGQARQCGELVDGGGTGTGTGDGISVGGAATVLPHGSEVSIGYIGLQQPRSARRSALLSEYYFECGCARCVREEGEKTAGGKREGGRAKGKTKARQVAKRKSESGS